MTITEQILMEIYRRTGGDVDTVVDMGAIAAALALKRDEASSAFRVLELTGLITFTTEAGRSGVRMTARGVERCGPRCGESPR